MIYCQKHLISELMDLFYFYNVYPGAYWISMGENGKYCGETGKNPIVCLKEKLSLTNYPLLCRDFSGLKKKSCPTISTLQYNFQEDDFIWALENNANN